MKSWKHWSFVVIIAFLGIIVSFTACPPNGNGNETPKTFTVTFNSNGGSEVNPKIVNKGEKVEEPQGVIKDKNTFVGWYKEGTFVNKWDFSNETVTADVTLYAKWIQREFSIVIDGFEEHPITVKDMRVGNNDVELGELKNEGNLSVISILKAGLEAQTGSSFVPLINRGFIIEVENTEQYQRFDVRNGNTIGARLSFILENPTNFASRLGSAIFDVYSMPDPNDA